MSDHSVSPAAINEIKQLGRYAQLVRPASYIPRRCGANNKGLTSLCDASRSEMHGKGNTFVVELNDEDCTNDGAFVLVGSLAEAIARAKGSANFVDATRKMFSIVNGGVQLKMLRPLDPENLTPLAISDYGHGIVPFTKLVEWGRSLPAPIEFNLAKSKAVVGCDLKVEVAVSDQATPAPIEFNPAKNNAAVGCEPQVEVAGNEQATPALKEPVEQRRERYRVLYEAEKRYGDRGALARAASLAGVDRSNMKKDIDKALAARREKTRAGAGWITQRVKDGKRVK